MPKLKHRENRNREYRKKSIKDTQDTVKMYNTYNMNPRRMQKNDAKAIFEDIMAKNFPNEE